MPIVAELKITLDSGGAINVLGPIDQKLLCYGLLEVAKDVIRAHDVATQRRIVPVGVEALANLATS